jgi:hypothetical protein
MVTVRQREHICPNMIGSERQEREIRGLGGSSSFDCESSSMNFSKISQIISTGSSVTSKPRFGVGSLRRLMEFGFGGEWFPMRLEARAAEPFEGCPVGAAFEAREYKRGTVLFIPQTMSWEGYPGKGGNRRVMGRRPPIPAATNLQLCLVTGQAIRRKIRTR